MTQSDDEALLALFRKLLGSAAPDPPDVDPDHPDADASDTEKVRLIFRTTTKKENQ